MFIHSAVFTSDITNIWHYRRIILIIVRIHYSTFVYGSTNCFSCYLIQHILFHPRISISLSANNPPSPTPHNNCIQIFFYNVIQASCICLFNFLFLLLQFVQFFLHFHMPYLIFLHCSSFFILAFP